MTSEPRFGDVLRAAARFQTLEPDAVLVGGSASSFRAGHRVSLPADHVLADLRGRFDGVLLALEQTDGWVTARVRRPVLILGSLDGVETGIRQLIRRRPLEVEEVDVEGTVLRVPTIDEIFRIKSWLVLRRNATRDYLDVVALADRLRDRAADVALSLDDYYADQIGPDGRRVVTQLAKQLAEPAPYDLSEVDLLHYRKLEPHWRDWHSVVAATRVLAVSILHRIA